jgi:hypothetical protein
MNEFDNTIRRAVRDALVNTVVPKPPNSLLEPAFIRRPQPRRWVIYSAAALSLALLLIAFVGRSAIAELENTVSAAIRFFEADSNGQLHPVKSESLTLDEALQTQEFRVVAPLGLPPRASLQSIQRLGSGPSTLVIFDYLYGEKSFSIVESPANSVTTGNIFYSRQPTPMSGNHAFNANSGMQFKAQAPVWISGSARVELFAANALAPDEIARIEHAMQQV